MRYITGFVLLLLIAAGCGNKPQPITSASEQFKYAKQLYDKNKSFKAQVAFENLIYTYPGNSAIDTAQYYLGMCYFNQKEYGIAAGEFKRLLSAYPQSEFTDDAQFQVGMCHYKMSPKYQLDQQETYLALDEFRYLIVNYPGSPYRELAAAKIKELENKLAKKKFKAGILYLKMGNYESALTYFKYVRDNYSATDWAIQAFYYTGEAQMKLGRYEEALTTFDNFLIGFSDHEFASKAKKKIEQITEKNKSSEN
ncbi:MAG: outer membrane protein assembly factor BamD [candidate division Zixibacteria bacterium]|nr:outer membrane protein assembly factor BamD [candidate division Zixibacteria bacterium]